MAAGTGKKGPSKEDVAAQVGGHVTEYLLGLAKEQQALYDRWVSMLRTTQTGGRATDATDPLLAWTELSRQVGEQAQRTLLEAARSKSLALPAWDVKASGDVQAVWERYWAKASEELKLGITPQGTVDPGLARRMHEMWLESVGEATRISMATPAFIEVLGRTLRQNLESERRVREQVEDQLRKVGGVGRREVDEVFRKLQDLERKIDTLARSAGAGKRRGTK